MGAARSQPTPSNATARRASRPARRVANRTSPCAVRDAAGGSASPRTPAWISGTTGHPAGTWAAACPWRRRWAPGGFPAVPPKGTRNGWRATAGYRRAACSGARLTGAPGRPALRALRSALAGVQPATGCGPRPSGPGKAAASSRIALTLRRASVVSTSEAGTDDAGNAASCKAAVPVCRDNGGTTGSLARSLPDSHRGPDAPLRDGAAALPSTPSGGANRRAEGLPIWKKRIVLTALFNTCGFSAAGSGH